MRRYSRQRENCGKNGKVAILGRNGRYEKNNPTSDFIWNQSILPISRGTGDIVETFYLLDHNNTDNILTDGTIKLTWI